MTEREGERRMGERLREKERERLQIHKQEPVTNEGVLDKNEI